MMPSTAPSPTLGLDAAVDRMIDTAIGLARGLVHRATTARQYAVASSSGAADELDYYTHCGMAGCGTFASCWRCYQPST